jgi:hypothetical protein
MTQQIGVQELYERYELFSDFRVLLPYRPAISPHTDMPATKPQRHRHNAAFILLIGWKVRAIRMYEVSGSDECIKSLLHLNTFLFAVFRINLVY